MAGRRLFFQIYPYFLLVAALSVVAVAWHASASFREFHVSALKDELSVRCALAGERVEAVWGSGLFKEECSRLAALSKGRLTVIDPAGKVLFDSEEDPARMGDHSKRPEFLDAFKTGEGHSIRYSATLNKNMLYVAVPLRLPSGAPGPAPGALRMALAIGNVEAEMKGLYLRLALGGLAVAFAAGLLSLLISKGISKPMEEMRRSAGRIADGDLDHRIPAPETEEMFALSASLNRMAEQLKARLREITEERNEREAILASMAEGVIAIDSDAKVISVNKAAERLFKLHGAVEGRVFHEVVRNSALQDFVSALLSGDSSKEADIEFHSEDQRLLQVKGGALKGSDGSLMGALIVVNDITRIRQLEDVRRDFVANVSHEIRTPVTAIKGSVETLLEGAIDNPDDAAKFLRIIVKHAERLNALVEDILSLSSIESGFGSGRISLASWRLREVLDIAAGLCREKAEARGVAFELDCLQDVSVKADRPLLEQAVVNLLDNAVKYSNEGSKVEIRGFADAQGRAVISVRDYGCGIPKEHIPRLFERFYRVDKARSRKLGGTGLGLAIVKHIVQAHNGLVSVDSTPGGGSTFTITLPA